MKFVALLPLLVVSCIVDSFRPRKGVKDPRPMKPAPHIQEIIDSLPPAGAIYPPGIVVVTMALCAFVSVACAILAYILIP
jgi:hypothetical protein